MLFYNMNLSKKYKEKFGHLEGVKSLGWGSDYSQKKRFDILLDIGVDINDSVLDVGCGYGDFSKNFVNYLINDFTFYLYKKEDVIL
jgi:hypothetical protein